MKARRVEFDWCLYKEPIKKKLYEKAKNHSDLTATFSPKEINADFVISIDKLEDFMRWLKKEKIASNVKLLGNNLFECTLTDSFLKEELSKELFEN